MTTAAYIALVDSHLATLATARERVSCLEEALDRAYRVEEALERWARRPTKHPPTHFSAFELAAIINGLNRRLANAQDEINAARAAVE
jgi:hypothetical protein